MSRAQRRHLRTVILGIAAMATLIWSAVDQFAISWAEIRQLFFAVLLGVLIVMACAGLGVLIWQLIIRLINRQ